MNRLLIVACSERKNPLPELVPAIERYDGPIFRVLRKFLCEYSGQAPEILILSAKFGLIGPSDMIPEYNCRLTADAATRLRPAVLAKLRAALQSSPVTAVGLCLGRDYMQAVKGFETYLPGGTSLEYIGGGLGRRLTRLREWLHNGAVTKSDNTRERGKGVVCARDESGAQAGKERTGCGRIHRGGTATTAAHPPQAGRKLVDRGKEPAR